MNEHQTTETEPSSAARTAGRDLYLALASHVDRPDPFVLAVVGPDVAGDGERLTAQLASVTASETDRPILVVQFVPSMDDPWALQVVPNSALGPVPIAHLSPESLTRRWQTRAACAEVAAELTVLRRGAYAVLRVPPEATAGSEDHPSEVAEVLEAAREAFHLVLVDLPPAAARLTRHADGVVVLVGPDASLAHATSKARHIEASGGDVIGAVICAAPGSDRSRVATLWMQSGSATRTPSVPEARSAPDLPVDGDSMDRLFSRVHTRVAALVAVWLLGMVAVWQVLVPADGGWGGAASARRDRTPIDLTDPTPDIPLPTRTLLSASASTTPALGPPVARRGVTTRLGGPAASDGSRPTAPPQVTTGPTDGRPAGAPARASATVAAAVSEVARPPADPIAPPDEPAAVVAGFHDAPEVAFAGVGGVTAPERLEEFAVAPRYASLPGLGPVEATVLLSAVVKADGSVGDVRLLELAGSPADVAGPAIEAVKQWRYRPAMKDGRPVDALVTVLLDFRASSS